MTFLMALPHPLVRHNRLRGPTRGHCFHDINNALLARASQARTRLSRAVRIRRHHRGRHFKSTRANAKTPEPWPQMRPGSGDDPHASVTDFNAAEAQFVGLLRRLLILKALELLEQLIHFRLEILKPLVIFALEDRASRVGQVDCLAAIVGL